jgi:hypothetical protein
MLTNEWYTRYLIRRRIRYLAYHSFKIRRTAAAAYFASLAVWKFRRRV